MLVFIPTHYETISIFRRFLNSCWFLCSFYDPNVRGWSRWTICNLSMDICCGFSGTYSLVNTLLVDCFMSMFPQPMSRRIGVAPQHCKWRCPNGYSISP